MKKLLLPFLSLSLCCSLAAQQQMPELPPLSDEELELFAQIFENMDEKTLDALAKIGEEFIQEELKAGRDPFAIFNQPAEPAQKPAQPAQPVTPAQPATPTVTVDIKTVDQLRDTLHALADRLTTIRQRADGTRRTREMIAPWKYHIDDLIYYSHTLSQDKLLKYLADKEFITVATALKTVEQELAFLEPLFHVRELAIEEENPYTVLGVSPRASLEEIHAAYKAMLEKTSPEAIKKQYPDNPEEQQKALRNATAHRADAQQAYTTIMAHEQSVQALENMLESIKRAIYDNDLINGIKKLLARYEPEALKIKEEQEKREVAARKEQEELIKRKPSFVAPLFEPFDNKLTGTPAKPSRPSRPDKGAPTVPSAGAEKNGGLTPSKAPDQKGGDKNKDLGKDKKGEPIKGKDEKDKEKDKDKKDIKLPPQYKHLEDKVVAIDKIFKDIVNEIEKEPASDIGIALKDIFKDFPDYLTKSIPTPYSDNTAKLALSKAKQINEGLVKLTEHFNKIKNEMRKTLKDLTPTEKSAFKKSVKSLLDKYMESHLNNKKYLQDLMTLTLNEDQTKVMVKGTMQPISPDKQYLHFGKSTIDATDANNKPLLDLVKKDDLGSFIAYLTSFSDTFKKVQEQIKEKK